MEQGTGSASSAWPLRLVWGGFALSVALYLLGSLVGGAVSGALGWQGSPALGLAQAVVQGLMVLPPLVLLARWGRPISLLGLTHLRPWMVWPLLGALAAGFCGMMAWGLVLLPFGIRAQEPIVPLFGEGPLALLSVFVVGAIFAPLAEEIVFRGFLFGGLRHHVRPLVAALASAALFGAIHFQPYAFPVLFGLGLLLAWLYHHTRSLWPPIAMHFCVNALAIVVQYVAAQNGLI